MSKEAILNNQTRNRLAQLSYDDMTEDDIKNVLKEEYKVKEVPSFTLYKSSEMEIGKKSGFDGKVIYFKDQNELYFFARGTEPKYNDIMYDAAGIAAAGKIDQLNDAEDMYNEIIHQIIPKDLNKKS